MKRKNKICTIFSILMLVALPLTAIGQTIDTKEETIVELKLADFEKHIEDMFKDIQKEFSDEVYNELYSQVESALSKATFVNEDEEETVDLELFENELNSQPVGFRRNVIRFYDKIFISGEKDTFEIIRTPYEWHWVWQYDWVLGSNYKLELYNKWENRPGDIPLPIGDPVFYAKRVYFEGWEGWHKQIDQDGAPNGVAGLIKPVFAIGSLTKPNCRPAGLFIERLFNRFPVIALLLQLPAFDRILNR